MYLNKTNLFLVTNICLIFFLLSYNDVNSEEVKIISGIAKVTDGDTIRIEEKKKPSSLLQFCTFDKMLLFCSLE